MRWELTDEAREKIPEWNARWIKIILSTSPIDVEKTTTAIRGMYRAAGLDDSIEIVEAKSAMDGAKIWAERAATLEREKSGGDLDHLIRGNLERWHEPYNGGSEWASWCCFLSFVRDVCGFRHESHKAYAHYENAAIHGGPRFLHENFAVICQRAAVRNMDDEGRLHCEDGPAISWHCGTKDWYIQGIRLDEQIVMSPATQTIEQINRERNEDVKSIRLERFGWLRYMRESGIDEPIDERSVPADDTLEQLYRFPDGSKRFVVTCPTGKIPVLGVPNHVKTCAEAQEWLDPSPTGGSYLFRT